MGLPLDHRVLDCADALDTAFHQVSGFQNNRRVPGYPNTGRRAGGNDIPWKKGDVFAEVFQDEGNIEDQVLGIAILHGYAVNDSG
jgi:hypothetical protein